MNTARPESGGIDGICRPAPPHVGWMLVFYGFLITLTVLSLCPIWMNRFLPMQDYPQHLFLSHIIATFDNPAYNWKEYYTVDLKLRPYMLWYLVMKPLTLLYGVEAAGKILFSLYILLISALVHVSRRICPQNALPWCALLLYPFAFNQIYFMGFPNFVISLPVLMLAVLDLEEFACKDASLRRLAIHAMYLATLYLCHPYNVLVYICLATASALCFRGNRRLMLKILAPAGALGVALLIWYVLHHGPSPAPNPYVWHVTWLPVKYSILFYTIMFTGMRLTIGPEWLTLGGWIAVAATIIHALCHNPGAAGVSRVAVTQFYAAVAGFVVLPFWFGYYSYFNLRLAPVSYFLLALLLARLRIRPRTGILVAASAMLLVVLSSSTQARVSQSSEMILPVIDAMKKNGNVLPLLFDSASTDIEPVVYGLFHAQLLNYYHVLAGGGANPALFRSAMLPVQYRGDVLLPYPLKAGTFSWREHGAYYTYFLLRKAPKEFSQKMSAHFDLIAVSGPWQLYQNRAVNQPRLRCAYE